MQGEPDLFWEHMARPAPAHVTVGGQLLQCGSVVRLQPRPGGDLLDAALAGRVAVIDGIEEDDAGVIHVLVVLEDDPGRELGKLRLLAHRFFFSPEDLEPLQPHPEPGQRVLVAGIGNIFFGDDGFGVAVARRLLREPFSAGVKVADFGIRGMDLAYELCAGYDAAILLDAVPRGKPPGSIFLLEPEGFDASPLPVNSHRMDPMAVLGLACQLGVLPPRLLIVGCEPGRIDWDNFDSCSMNLTPAVNAAVDKAADLVQELLGQPRVCRT
jgi:hydrogenase maturation protease